MQRSSRDLSWTRRAIAVAAACLAITGLTALEPQRSFSQSPSRTPIWGFADLHNHQFSNLAFGGLVLWGAPFSHDGNIATALPWSDWTPSRTGFCKPNDPGSGTCSSEVVNPSGDPVGVTGCGALFIQGCGKTQSSPALQGTCPAPTSSNREPACDGVLIHGAGGVRDLINNVLSESFGHLVGGHPQFDGWPRWNNYTGQQVYYEWLKRAHDGGLRLMTMLAVNNEVLCGVSDQIRGYGCNDMPAVDRQIQAAKDLEAFIDAQSGGPGQGWYRIAYSGAQARQIASQGKLAVVLGAEVPGIFGCKKNAACTAASVKSELQRYYNLGIRHLFPTHIADNAFSGTALYTGAFDFVNKMISGDWWDAGGCDPNSGIDFHLKHRDDIQDLARRAQSPAWNDPIAWAARWAGLTTQNAPPPVPAGGNCNNRGLQPLGQVLVDEMMRLGMIIDVDHQSGRALDAILQRAGQARYPAIAMGHTGFIETGVVGSTGETKRHEGNKTRAQVEALRALGGLPGVILHQGGSKEIVQYKRSDQTFVPFVCGNSSEAWAQVYLYGVERMQHASTDRWPADPTAAAFGSDFNGFAGMPAPRFGGEKCHGDFPDAYVGPGRLRVQYPFTTHGPSGTSMDKLQVGNKLFDINEDGLANVGLYPDYIEELKKIGVRSNEIDPLFNSAEAYIRMWERAEDRAPPAVSCAAPDGLWHASNVSLACTSSDVISELETAADASFTLSTSVPAGTETANAATGTRRVCDRRLNCVDVGPIAGNKIDRKPPSISITTPADGASYVVGESATVSFGCSDGGSGGASCTGTHPNTSPLPTATPGSYTFRVDAADAVANADAKTVAYSVTYGVCPAYDESAPRGSPGRVVALRVRLCDAAGANLSSPLVTLTAKTVDGAGPPPYAGNSNAGWTFRFDPVDALYVYNLDTSGMASGPHTLIFGATGDPIDHRLGFVLR